VLSISSSRRRASTPASRTAWTSIGCVSAPITAASDLQRRYRGLLWRNLRSGPIRQATSHCGGSRAERATGGRVKGDDRHYSLVAEFRANREVVPFLGAGANLCDWAAKALWETRRFLPNGRELPRALGRPQRLSRSRRPGPFARFAVSRRDPRRGAAIPLPHAVFDAEHPPSSVQRLFARLPVLLRGRGREQLLVLTTNYDDLVEREMATGKLGAGPTRRCSRTQCSAATSGAADAARAGSAPGQ
jgi:hypothetical protein